MRRFAITAIMLLGCGSSGPAPFIDIDKKLDRYDGLDLPITGDLAVTARLTSPNKSLATASGTATIHCGQCFLGDGGNLEPKLAPGDRRGAFLGDGIAIPKISLGEIAGTATFRNGKGTVELHAGNPDAIEIEVTGTVTLAARAEDSSGDLVLRFHASDAVRANDPKTYALLQLTGAPLDEAGWFRIRVLGTAAAPRLLSR